jgi:hypothetical protein
MTWEFPAKTLIIGNEIWIRMKKMTRDCLDDLIGMMVFRKWVFGFETQYRKVTRQDYLRPQE